jgi:hypothetical protein
MKVTLVVMPLPEMVERGMIFDARVSPDCSAACARALTPMRD